MQIGLPSALAPVPASAFAFATASAAASGPDGQRITQLWDCQYDLSCCRIVAAAANELLA